MNLLGSVGQLYTFILLVILFLGSGLAVWRLVDFLVEKLKAKQSTQQHVMQHHKKLNLKGGLLMGTNGWLKLAVFSLVGMVVSVMILGFVSTGYSQGGNIHQQHAQVNGNMNMAGGMNVNVPMGNMQMMGNMNMNGYGTMPMNNMSMNSQSDLYMMQQQMNQMQMMLNQMQQQMMMNNSNMQMQGGMSGNMSGGMGMGGMNMGGSMGSSSSGSMGMMGGMM